MTTPLTNPVFTLIEGDIRNLTDCQKAVDGCDYVLHQAALGSVPRSINDPITTNDVNIGGFLNMLFMGFNGLGKYLVVNFEPINLALNFEHCEQLAKHQKLTGLSLLTQHRIRLNN